MMKSILKLFACISMAAVATAVGAQGNSVAQKPAGSTSTYDKALLSPSTLTAKAPDTYDVKFVTTEGEFVIHVTRAWAPLGADRFYNLVRHHYYDGVAFYRVISGFMAQFGLSPYPAVTHAWSNASIKDDPVKQSNTRGRITFATAGPNTRTTELFINFGNNSGLDSQGFAPFGQVSSGMDIVDKIYNGYGESTPGGNGPDPGKIGALGKSFLEKSYPKLTVIKSATVESAAPPAGAATKPGANP